MNKREITIGNLIEALKDYDLNTTLSIHINDDNSLNIPIWGIKMRSDIIDRCEKQFICVSKCPELDCDNARHCITTERKIRERSEEGKDYCPCGNTENWKEIN